MSTCKRHISSISIIAYKCDDNAKHFIKIILYLCTLASQSFQEFGKYREKCIGEKIAGLFTYWDENFHTLCLSSCNNIIFPRTPELSFPM